MANHGDHNMECNMGIKQWCDRYNDTRLHRKRRIRRRGIPHRPGPAWRLTIPRKVHFPAGREWESDFCARHNLTSPEPGPWSFGPLEIDSDVLVPPSDETVLGVVTHDPLKRSKEHVTRAVRRRPPEPTAPTSTLASSSYR